MTTLDVPYPTALARFERLRQSDLATFDRCALSAKFDAEYRTGWSSLPQARGTITHRVLAECLKDIHRRGRHAIDEGGVPHGMIPTDAALAIFYEVARQNGVDDRCGKCNAPSRYVAELGKVECDNGHQLESNFVNLPADQWKDVRWITIKFANDSRFDIENLVDVEQRLLAPITYPDGKGGHVERTLTGQLDALFVIGEDADHAIVLDWKDTWSLPAPTEVGFDGYFQQRFYAWLVMKNYPTVQRVTLREHYVRYSQYREADVWRHDLPDVEELLSAIAERFDHAAEEGNYPPSPGQHCHSMCARPDLCPIFPGVRTAGAIQSPEQALQYSREATVARAALNNRLRELRPWSNANGPLLISDHKGPRVWGYHTRTRTSRPERETLERALRMAGALPALEDPTDPDSRALPDLVDLATARDVLDLGELYTENLQTKFEEHQPDPTTHPGQAEEDERLMGALEESVARNERQQDDFRS